MSADERIQLTTTPQRGDRPSAGFPPREQARKNLYTDSAPVPVLDDAFDDVFGSGQIGSVPSLLIWLGVFVVVGHVILCKTGYGRRVLATGSNKSAARFSGVATRRLKFYVLLAASTFAALAGMLYAGRLQSGRYQWDGGDGLSVIAAVILGGTSLFGGYGTVLGSVLDALLVSLINDGLTPEGLEFSQERMRGAIILLALARKGLR